MALLSKAKRKKYMKVLGYEYTKEGLKALQKDYFVRAKDIDGEYGRNTDILLVNAYRVKKYTQNFKLEEFKCECGGRYCTGYPNYISKSLLKNIQKLRDTYRAPMSITSGLRCQRYNDSLVGSIKNSRHVQGRAIDFYGTMTNTSAKRAAVKRFWYKLKNASYTYSDTPNMGTSIHVDVNK